MPCPSSDYKEYHTDTTVKFVVTLSEQRMMEAEREGFHKKFKLEGALTTSNMVGDIVCAAYGVQYMVCIHISLPPPGLYCTLCVWMLGYLV